MKIFNRFSQFQNRDKDTGRSRAVPLLAVVLSVAVVLTGAISIAVSGTKAKYKTMTSVTQTPATVTVEANLAASVTVQEHKAVRQDSGVYELNKTGAPVTDNTYYLMPGVDVPKDPFVSVTGKSDIEAYLYLEVISTGMPASGVSYTIDAANWKRLTDITPREIYVYAPGGSEVKLNGSHQVDIQEINVLQDQKITVSSEFDPSSFSSAATLNFRSYMAQAIGTNSASATFTNQLAGITNS